jgi:hypothetical protein
MLRSATTTGTYSNCVGNGTQTVFLEMSPSCPPPRGSGQAVQYGLLARYTAGKAALDFGCSDQYSSGGATTTTTTITGTLTATDPIPCGLWTPGCSIAAARTTGSA